VFPRYLQYAVRDFPPIFADSASGDKDCFEITSSKVKVPVGAVTKNSTLCADFRPSCYLLKCTSYIRPRLESCIQSWSPHLMKDIETLERIQRTATRLVPQLRKFSYEERLQKLGLTTLEQRRQRGDMIEVFKLLEGVENVDYNQFFTSATTSYALRGHDRKLTKTRSRLDIRKFFFSQRVVNTWNNLPASVVPCTSNICEHVQELIRQIHCRRDGRLSQRLPVH